tara:strand:+ start:487 stop:2640 length:2154 start_codon:yes stop_codon:yes gene_type:complete
MIYLILYIGKTNTGEITMSSIPHWVNVLRRTSFPNTSIISKASVLPAEDGGKWASLLTTDALTNKFIKDIESGDYGNKGISATIDVLKDWSSDERAWKKMREIKILYAGEGSMPHVTTPTAIKARVKLMVEKVLPILESNRKKGKSTRTGYRKNTELSEEFLDSVLSNLDESNPEETINYLNERFKDSQNRKEFSKYLVANYGRKIRPILRELGLTDLRRIAITTDTDLSSLGFNKEGKTWVLARYPIDKLDKLKEKVSSMTTGRFSTSPLPIVSVFGMITESQEEELSSTKYELVEPFTPEKARYLLSKIKESPKLFPKDIIPTSIKNMKQRDKYIHYSLIELLDEDFTSSVEQGTFADDFISYLKQKKGLGKGVLQNYANIVWDVSTENYDDTHEYHLPELGREVKPNKQEWMPKIVSALKSGDLKDTYDRTKKRLTVSVNQSISESQYELLSDLLRDESLTSEADGEIVSLIDDLQGKGGFDKPAVLSSFKKYSKESKRGLEGVDVYSLPSSEKLEKVRRLLSLSKSITGEEISELRDELQEQYGESDKQFQTQFSESQIDFNESAFPSEFDRDIAEITYMGLSRGEGLSDVLSGEYKKGEIGNISNIFNVLISADQEYKTEEQLSVLSRKIAAPEEGETFDFTANPPPYKDEILEFSGAFRKNIDNTRASIIKDLKENLMDLAANTDFYWKQRNKGKHNIYSILTKGGLLRVA